MSNPVSEITLTTGGYGTKGFTFSVLSNEAGHLDDKREQVEDPYFDKDYNNDPFVAGIVYRFLGYHPVHMADEELIRVVFKETGGYDIVDPSEENSTGSSSLTSLVARSNDLDRDAVYRAFLRSLAPETLLLLGQTVLTTISANPSLKQLFCAIAATCNLSGTVTKTYTATNIIQWSPVSILAPLYDASLDFVNCSQCGGWVYDLNNLNTPAKLRVFINGIFAGIATATFARPEVADVLGLSGATTHICGWTFTIPDVFKNGEPITVEIRPLSGTTAFRYSPRTSDFACVSLSNLIDVAVDATVTAPDSGFGPIWVAEHLTDDDPDSAYTTPCVGETEPVTIRVDLGGTAAPQQIRLVPNNFSDGADWLPVDYQLSGSTDGITWFVLATVTNQARTTQEIVLPVETDLDANYRSLRYVRLVTSKNSNAGGACNYVRLNSIRIMAPSKTPDGGTPPTRLPKKLEILGPLGQNEGAQTNQKVWLTYTNGDTEDVTAASNKTTGGDFSLTWGADGVLFAAVNSTPNDTRSPTLTAAYLGLNASKVIQIYDASITRYITGYRIDRIETSQAIIEGGPQAHFKVVALFNQAPLEEQYTESGAYSINTPYPDGMTATTGMNAIGTVTLPMGSITANLTRTLRFTFPAGGGYVEKLIDLINVADTAVFDKYEIVGPTEAVEGGSDPEYSIDAVYTNGSRQNYIDSQGAYGLFEPYPPGVDLIALADSRTKIHTPINSITADVPGKIFFTFGNGAVIEKAIVFKNVANQTTPLSIAKVTVFHPTGWHSILPSSGTVSENLVILVRIEGTNAANADVRSRYLQSRNDATYGVMQKLDYNAQTSWGTLPPGYTHVTFFADEDFSNTTRALNIFAVKLQTVANSEVQPHYLPQASTPDHTTVQLYPL
ncbi:discoidin domain-containing protein [Spirosoma agri]|uniref:Discoidin domain-containing protein n=1 Tax=Spirosoma agri TaxID=1987381 RepID=A0A6M0ILL7_9BACT|nr:discoidin domain-containing protein [Spirosoma agri]NEU68301.1 discoidin domain-containing protein [Spirosoma agri]